MATINVCQRHWYVDVTHQSFVCPPPPPWDRDIGDIVGLKCRNFTFDVSQQCHGWAGVLFSTKIAGKNRCIFSRVLSGYSICICWDLILCVCVFKFSETTGQTENLVENPRKQANPLHGSNDEIRSMRRICKINWNVIYRYHSCRLLSQTNEQAVVPP